MRSYGGGTGKRMTTTFQVDGSKEAWPSYILSDLWCQLTYIWHCWFASACWSRGGRERTGGSIAFPFFWLFFNSACTMGFWRVFGAGGSVPGVSVLVKKESDHEWGIIVFKILRTNNPNLHNMGRDLWLFWGLHVLNQKLFSCSS